MQYAILVYETPEDFANRTNPDAQEYWASYQSYSDALAEAGVSAGGKALEGPETAKCLRVNGEARQIEDGPFADTKEQLGGFFLIEAESLDKAMEWAARCPCAATGAAEVRPVPDYPSDAKKASGKPATHVLLLYEDEAIPAAMTPDQQEAMFGEYFAYTSAVSEAGAFVAGEPLDVVATATSIRLRDGARDVQDGPYAETKEQLGGFYAIHAASDEEAFDWAAKCPAARTGHVEVRPALKMGS